MQKYSHFQGREDWTDLNVVPDEGEDQWRGYPVSFCLGTRGKSGGCPLVIRGRGCCMSPCKVQGVEPPIVLGSNYCPLAITESTSRRGAFKMCWALKGTLFIHLLTQKTHCVLIVEGWKTASIGNSPDRSETIIAHRHCWADTTIQAIKGQEIFILL